MRTVGDLAWINDYIGIPYVEGGRDILGVDCYGLVKLIYQNEYSEMLPDWLTDVIDPKIRNGEFQAAINSGDFTEKEKPEDGDLVICFRTRAAYHMGIYYGGGVLHANRGIGSIYEPLTRFQQQYTKLVFGEWHPCL